MWTEQIIGFASRHWLLSLGLLIVILLIIANEIRERLTGIPSLSPDKVTDLMNHHSAKIIDLRTPMDYQKGHILNAINIPMKELGEKIAQLEPYKDQPLVLTCAAGLQAPNMGRLLRKAGFTRVSCLAGGLGGWKQNNLPLVK